MSQALDKADIHTLLLLKRKTSDLYKFTEAKNQIQYTKRGLLFFKKISDVAFLNRNYCCTQIAKKQNGAKPDIVNFKIH